MTNEQVTIRINGPQKPVLEVLEKIKPNFPLCIQSKLKENDDGSGVHVFLTVALREA